MPAFYRKPRSLTEAIDHIAGRVINLLDLPGVRADVGPWHGASAQG